VVDRSSFSCVGSLFNARGAATEKALSPIRRRVRDEAAVRIARVRTDWDVRQTLHAVYSRTAAADKGRILT